MITFKCISFVYAIFLSVYPYGPDPSRYILAMQHLDNGSDENLIIETNQALEIGNDMFNNPNYMCRNISKEDQNSMKPKGISKSKLSTHSIPKEIL